MSSEPSEEPKIPRKASAEKLAATAATEDLKQRLEKALSEKNQSDKKAAEYLDRLKRLQADMENLQKLTQRQVQTMRGQASESVILKLLPILDALSKAEGIAHSDNNLPPEEIAVGLGMLERQLVDALREEGLEEIKSQGEPFDTSLHEAVSYVETDDKPENTVVEEIRKGYLLNGKVIRPSLVTVSRRPALKEDDSSSKREE